MTRVVVVDDEVHARGRLREMLAGEPDAELVGEYATVPEAIAGIRETQPDLLFLDVQLLGRNGFEVLEALGPDALPTTVFVTAYQEYAIRAFDVHAVDYLLKPFDRARFRRAYQRAAQLAAAPPALNRERMTSLVEEVASEPETDEEPPRRKKPIRWIVLKDLQRSMRLLRTRDIDWIEAAGNYVYLHVGRERHLHRETLRNLAQKLDPDAFVRVHRSTIVRLSCIDRIEPWVGGDYILKLKTGAEVRLSRNFREEFERHVGRE